MTREDIIRMAREASGGTDWWPVYGDTLERFADLVAQKTAEEFEPLFASMRSASDVMAQTAGKIAAFEREECARVCDEIERPNLYGVKECAAAIRERSKA